MRTVPIFIASSVREFQNERRELSEFLDMLNSVYKKLDVRLEWNRPETASRVMVRGGSQRTFDAYIEESEFFAINEQNCRIVQMRLYHKDNISLFVFALWNFACTFVQASRFAHL